MSQTTTITITVQPTRPDVDVSRAIRWLLKRLLRQWGLRCVRVSWDAAGEGAESESHDVTVNDPDPGGSSEKPKGGGPDEEKRNTLYDGNPSGKAGLNSEP